MNFRSSNLLRSANQETTSNSDSNESEYSNPFDLNGGQFFNLEKRNELIQRNKDDAMEFDDKNDGTDVRINNKLRNIIGNLRSRFANIASISENPELLNNADTYSLNYMKDNSNIHSLLNQNADSSQQALSRFHINFLN